MNGRLLPLSLASAAMVLSLAGCSGNGGTDTTAEIPAVCRRFSTQDEQQNCLKRWQVAQSACQTESEAALQNADPGMKFSLARCILSRMNLPKVVRSSAQGS